MITKGQKVLPTQAQALGYASSYPHLAEALRALFAEAKDPSKPSRHRASVGGAVTLITEGPSSDRELGRRRMIAPTDETDPPRR